MKKIIFFSHNKNKIREILKLFQKSRFNILSLNNFPNIEEPKELGSSFEKNAEIKSNYGFKHLKLPCFADDSGICINALENLPGIRSKRFLEENGGEEKALEMIINKTKLLLDNRAYFKTSICLTFDENKTIIFNGIIKGMITSELRGHGGFHYDPIFIPDGYNKTFAEMSLKEKNKISHRSIAIEKLKKYLSQSFN